MNFPGLSGNEALKERLRSSLDSGGLSHAYIIYGEIDEERKKLGNILASAMVCSFEGKNKPCTLCKDCKKSFKFIHPDIKIVLREKDKRNYGIDIIREMVRDASVVPNEASKKVYIIPEGDLLTPPCQNAALKILEEPPAYASFIILAESPGSFLETFRSRCIELFMCAENKADSCPGNMTDNFLEAFKSGDPLKIVSAAIKLEKCERPDLINELTSLRDALVNELRHSIGDRKKYYAAVDLLGRLLDMTDANVGAGQITGMLALGFNKILK